MKKIPPIVLTAAVSGKKVAFHRLGKPAVLLFLWQETQALAPIVEKRVRAKYPEADQVLIADIADLRGIPRLMRGLVEREMRKGYNQAVARLSQGQRPEDYVFIIADWEGALAKGVGATDTSSKPSVAVLDSEGVIVGLHQGEDLAEAAMQLLEKACQPASDKESGS